MSDENWIRRFGPRLRRGLQNVFVDVSPLRASPGFRWLYAGQVGVALSRQTLIVAVPYEVFVLTGSSLLVGMVGLVQIAPLIIFSVLGGGAADAFDRTRVLIVVQGLTALTCVGLALNAGPSASVWLIFVLIAINAALSGLEAPARTAIIPSLVDRRDLATAFALNQTLTQTAQVVGPAIAGLLMAQVGIAAAYWAAAAAGAFTAFALIPLGERRPEGAAGKLRFAAIADGWRYLRRAPVLQQTMLIDLNAMVFGMPRALFPVIGTVVLGGDAATVGLLHAALGAGALVGALTTGWVSAVKRQGRVVIYAAAGWGLAVVAFGLTRHIPTALALLAIGGAADVVSNVFRATILQMLVPDELRGRISSLKVALTGAGPRLGDTRAGAVGAITTPTFSVVSGGAAAIIGTVLIAWRGRALWEQTTDDDTDPGAVPW